MRVKIPLHEQMGPFLTIRKRAEDSCRTEAAIPGHGAHPDLHLVLSGSAEVCQHSLVSVTLCVVALIFTTPLLQHEKHELAGLEESVKQEHLKRLNLIDSIAFHNLNQKHFLYVGGVHMF